MVLMGGLVECSVVLWCYGCCVFMGFLLPHSPSVPSTFFNPSLKITYQTQSFGLVLVKVMRNSTYKVGWEEW